MINNKEGPKAVLTSIEKIVLERAAEINKKKKVD